MKEVKSDLIYMAEMGDLDTIVHGANCFNTMKSGIAGQLARKYPQVAEADNATVRGDREKLGTFTYAPLQLDNGHSFTVINAYTQYTYGRGADLFEYDAFTKVINHLEWWLLMWDADQEEGPMRIGFPHIGAGLAGGDWTRIRQQIANFSKRVEDHAEVTIVEYHP